MALLIGRVDPLEMWLGEDRTDGIDVTDEDGADLSALTGTYTVYAPDGTVALAADALTMSGTTTLNATHTVSAGAGNNLETAGRYRAVFTLTDGTDTWKWMGLIVVKDPTE